MLPKKNRIAEPRTFEALAKKGAEYKSPFLVCRFFKKSDPPSTFAVTVSAKIAKKAVQRNQLRRRVYEGLRLHLPMLKKNIVALIMLRKKALSASYADLAEEIVQFFNHLNADAK